MYLYTVKASLLGVLGSRLVTLHIPLNILDRHLLGRRYHGLVSSRLRDSRNGDRRGSHDGDVRLLASVSTTKCPKLDPKKTSLGSLHRFQVCLQWNSPDQTALGMNGFGHFGPLLNLFETS